MTELAIPADTLTAMQNHALTLSKADLLTPAFRGKPANVLLAMEAARALNVDPWDILQNAHVINGKLGLSAEFQRSLVQRSGHTIRVFMEGQTAVATGIRKDDPDFTYRVEWTLDRARAAGITNDNYKKHPAAMLKARATTELCRDAFADVIHGFQSPEELREIAEPVVAGVEVDDILADAAVVVPAERLDEEAGQ